MCGSVGPRSIRSGLSWQMLVASLVQSGRIAVKRRWWQPQDCHEWAPCLRPRLSRRNAILFSPPQDGPRLLVGGFVSRRLTLKRRRLADDQPQLLAGRRSAEV